MMWLCDKYSRILGLYCLEQTDPSFRWPVVLFKFSFHFLNNALFLAELNAEPGNRKVLHANREKLVLSWSAGVSAVRRVTMSHEKQWIFPFHEKPVPPRVYLSARSGARRVSEFYVFSSN